MNNNFLSIATFSLILISTPVASKIYQCKENGKITFQQTQCEDNDNVQCDSNIDYSKDYDSEELSHYEKYSYEYCAKEKVNREIEAKKDEIRLMKEAEEGQARLETDAERKIREQAKYLTFQWGSSACENISDWKKTVDLIKSKDSLPLRYLDRNCIYLRENTFVFGVLKKESYKNTDFAKIKASNGRSYWIDLGAVLPITSEESEQPMFWKTDIRSQ